jgi:hypothetical protein
MAIIPDTRATILTRAEASLQRHRPTLNLPGTDDPDAPGRILLVDPFGARLYQEVKLNMADRRFCRFGLEDQVPDHSTFSVNRHDRFRKGEILRTVFEDVVCGCETVGLVGGEGFAVDASMI